MMMSVLQGGPAPNFLAPPLAAYIVGKPLSPAEAMNIKYKKACENVCYKFPSSLMPIFFTIGRNIAKFSNVIGIIPPQAIFLFAQIYMA